MSLFGDFFRDPFFRDPFDDHFARRLDALFTPPDFHNHPATLLIGEAAPTDTNAQPQHSQNQQSNQVTTTNPQTTWQSLFRAPRLDVSSQDTTYTIKVDLPGIEKDKIDIHVEEGNVLSISGDRSEEREEQNEQFYRKERSYGKFERRVRLPADARLEEATAQMENGVLSLKVPKVEKQEERRKISIA
ncbi:hypothetical protein HDV00_000698 [Rhizophlyctis rosea]|nr:hypothetical protein HDV00_000698 [Rhizophlyctis rosea]